MRHHLIVEFAVREVAKACGYADMAYAGIEATLSQEASKTFLAIHSFLAHCGTVARLLRSEALSPYAEGRAIAEVIGVPGGLHLDDAAIRETLVAYDRRLADGLAATGEVPKVLDDNIGDRDAFEDDTSIFLRHYDPTVETLTLMEVEIPLRRLSAEILEIRSRAQAWLEANGELVERAAEISIPPST